MVETRLTNADLQHVLKAFISLNLILYNFGWKQHWKQKTVECISQRQPFVSFSTNTPCNSTSHTKLKAATPNSPPVATIYAELTKAIEDNSCKIFCVKIKKSDNIRFLERANQTQQTQLPTEDTGYHYAVAAGEILQATEVWQTLIILWKKPYYHGSNPTKPNYILPLSTPSRMIQEN